ncbi:uncharacterized protein [Porites lutea]|uniref:uncharacterized protein n=1 Tax=Porites lutea TaxID=51062 RepID=UPI003CC6AE3E
MASLRLSVVSRRLISSPFLQLRTMTVGEKGSGVGKGGGGGGDIRSAGGAFGKMEHAHEEQYFRKLEQEKLKEMKEHLEESMSYHEKEIKHHEDAIRRHRKAMDKHQKGIEKLSDAESSDDEKK